MDQPLPTLKVVPLTPPLWPAMEDLFGRQGPCSRCWCMYWRMGPAYRREPPQRNRAALRELVRLGPPPGLLAFHDRLAVGWCQLTPRSQLPYLTRFAQLKPADDLPVWAISCFYIRKGYRRRGVTAALIAAAISAARAAGAPALEAYPLDAALTSSTSFTGYASTFLRLGFQIVARNRAARPILRLPL